MMSSLPLKQKRHEEASGGASSTTLLLHPHRDWPSRDGLYSLTQYLSHILALIYPSIQRQYLSLLFWSIIHPQSLIYGSISRPCYTTFKTTILQQSVLGVGLYSPVWSTGTSYCLLLSLYQPLLVIHLSQTKLHYWTELYCMAHCRCLNPPLIGSCWNINCSKK